jgi:hypothetical protein
MHLVGLYQPLQKRTYVAFTSLLHAQVPSQIVQDSLSWTPQDRLTTGFLSINFSASWESIKKYDTQLVQKALDAKNRPKATSESWR